MHYKSKHCETTTCTPCSPRGFLVVSRTQPGAHTGLGDLKTNFVCYCLSQLEIVSTYPSKLIFCAGWSPRTWVSWISVKPWCMGFTQHKHWHRMKKGGFSEWQSRSDRSYWWGWRCGGIVEFWVFVPLNAKEIIICNAFLNYNILHELVIYNYLRTMPMKP